jgi:Tfp pilus assembly protein PilV
MKQVQASTLPEVIIAMVIIMIVFTMAIGIYTRITNSSFSGTQQKAQILAGGIIRNSIDQQDWEDSSVLIDSIEFKKTVSAFSLYNDLVEIKVEAFEQGVSKGICRQVVAKEDHED